MLRVCERKIPKNQNECRKNLLRPMFSHFCFFSLRSLKWGTIKSSIVTATRALMLDDTVLEKKEKECNSRKEWLTCEPICALNKSVCVCYCPLLYQLVTPSFELYLICYKRKTTVFFLLCCGLTSGCRCRRPPQTSQGFQGRSPAYPWRGRAAAGAHRQTLQISEARPLDSQRRFRNSR